MSYDSSDDQPLAKRFKKELLEDNIPLSRFKPNPPSDRDSFCSSDYCVDDSDFDPNYDGQCIKDNCVSEVFDFCIYCENMFCSIHLEDHKPCCNKKQKKRNVKQQKICKKNEKKKAIDIDTQTLQKDIDTQTLQERNNAECEVVGCNQEVFAACHRCIILLCWNHFEHNENCLEHVVIVDQSCGAEKQVQEPEDYTVEGGEDQHRPKKSPRKNIKKIAKNLRDSGKEHVNPKTKEIVLAKTIGERCNKNTCNKFGRECFKINEDGRMDILTCFYNLGNVQLQREFVVRHIECGDTKQKTTTNPDSRRKKSNKYFLTYKSNRLNVCKKFFLNTLGITEKKVRTAMAKVTNTGTVEPEKRGGRITQARIEEDSFNRQLIEDHIDRFPFVESHYCRAKTSRNYLHDDLSIPKMYNMFQEENKLLPKLPSISSYRRVFKTKNLSFHRPKKDQCTLCMTYLKGDIVTQSKLKEKFQTHCTEKTKVRAIKQSCKDKAKEDPKYMCASFDLQQVQHLPLSKESAVFYKRRLGVYNLTFYNIANKEVFCYTWDESQSKRGASEISTAVYNALLYYDNKGIVCANLFSDGCPGQNKNSIIPSMLLYFVSKSKSIEEVSLRFFEPFHGQNEGDSCHSAISCAIQKAGDVLVPSQLHPIYRLSRSSNPYNVVPLEFYDFLDFKKLSKDIRLLQERDVEGSTEVVVDWTKMSELKVSKSNLKEIQFKTSHLQENYNKLVLKRQKKKISKIKVEQLNSSHIAIAKAKYDDLVSLCSGATPVIRLEQHKMFYENLPHS